MRKAIFTSFQEIHSKLHSKTLLSSWRHICLIRSCDFFHLQENFSLTLSSLVIKDALLVMLESPDKAPSIGLSIAHSYGNKSKGAYLPLHK